MKRTNSIFVVARLMLLVLTLVITVFTFASCEGLPPELQGILGGNNNSSCEHTYDNACDTDCNECGTTRTTEHTYDNACDTDCNICGVTRETEHTYADGVCSVCGAADESVPTCEHTNIENCVCQDCGATVHDFPFIDVPMFMPASAPTCDKNGNIDYYYCIGCYQAFSDADGKNKLNYSDFIIPALGHDYVDGACERCGAIECKHTTVENCVCKDCNEAVHTNVGHEPANPPDCNTPGNIECYGCYDCNKLFSDAECKNEITLEEALIPAIGEHKMVGGVCEFCGTTNPNGGGGNDGSNDSQGPDYVPTSLELAVQALNELYGRAYQLVTTSDYELVSKIVIDGEEFTVTWVIANESITLTYDEARGVYLVDIPDDIPDEYGEDLYYSIVATISDGEGQSEEHLYKRVLKPAENR